MSLNDSMLAGQTVQIELITILLRFQMFRFMFVTDVEKIYRRILVHQNPRRYQLIV